MVHAKPVVTGTRITFAADSKQLPALGVSSVVELEATGIELTGRLVWDENRTVRI